MPTGCTRVLHFLLQDTIIFGADEFELGQDRKAELASGQIPLGIGANTQIRKAIIDKNVRVGCNVQLLNKTGIRDGRNMDLPKGVVIREGIIVVKRDAQIPDGTVI